MMVLALEKMVDEESRYTAARTQMLDALNHARSLGTSGLAPATRDALHER